MKKKFYIELIFLILLGALTSLSLPPLNYFVINFITLSLFYIFLIKKNEFNKNKKIFFLYGWLFGFGYFVSNLYWISISLTFDEDFKFLIPFTIILVPGFYVIANFGMINSLWGVILPGAATPTGVFLLRQYMLTLPRELIEAARMDHASEWAIYWRVVLPLSIPAIAVLAIFSIMWRWNDFLWPLIVLSKSEVYTLQIGLNAFHGELTSQWNYVLSMTMVTLLPIAIIFVYLQKFITTGIASTGMK